VRLERGRNGGIYFLWNPAGQPIGESPLRPVSPFRCFPRGLRPSGFPRRRRPDSLRSRNVVDGRRSAIRRQSRVSWKQNGDLYVREPARRNGPRRLTQTVRAETQPVVSRRMGRIVYFVRGQQRYSLAMADGAVKQLTDIRSGPAPIDSRLVPVGPARISRAGSSVQLFRIDSRPHGGPTASRAPKAEGRARAAGLQPILHREGRGASSRSNVSPNARAALVVVGQPAMSQRQAEGAANSYPPNGVRREPQSSAPKSADRNRVKAAAWLLVSLPDEPARRRFSRLRSDSIAGFRGKLGRVGVTTVSHARAVRVSRQPTSHELLYTVGASEIARGFTTIESAARYGVGGWAVLILRGRLFPDGRKAVLVRLPRTKPDNRPALFGKPTEQRRRPRPLTQGQSGKVASTSAGLTGTKRDFHPDHERAVHHTSSNCFRHARRRREPRHHAFTNGPSGRTTPRSASARPGKLFGRCVTRRPNFTARSLFALEPRPGGRHSTRLN